MKKKLLTLTTLLLFCTIGSQFYLQKNIYQNNDTLSFPRNFDSVTKETAVKVDTKFSEIYKTISFISSQKWSEKNMQDNLAIRFNEIVNLYPYISGIVALKEDGTFFSSNTLNKQGEEIGLSSIAQTSFQKSSWYQDFLSSPNFQDLNKQLVGLKVGKFTEIPWLSKQKDQQFIPFGKIVWLKNVFNKPLKYSVFYFVNTSWIENILKQSHANLELFSKKSNVTFLSNRSEVHKESPIIRTLTLDENEITKNLNWEVTYSTTPLSLGASKAENYNQIYNLAYILFSFVFLGISLFFKSGDYKKILIKDTNVSNLNKLHNEMTLVKKKYHGIQDNLTKVSDKLNVLQVDIKEKKQNFDMEEIDHSLTELTQAKVVEDVFQFKNHLKNIVSAFNNTSQVIHNLNDFKNQKNQDDNSILQSIDSIKETVNSYRIEALNLGLASENNATETLKYITQDLYALSTSLLEEVQSFQDKFNLSNKGFEECLNASFSTLEQSHRAINESQEVESLTNNLNLTVERQIDVTKKISEKLKLRKEHEAAVKANFTQLSSSLVHSLDILEKEKQKIEDSEKELSAMVEDIQGIRRRQQATH